MLSATVRSPTVSPGNLGHQRHWEPRVAMMLITCQMHFLEWRCMHFINISFEFDRLKVQVVAVQWWWQWTTLTYSVVKWTEYYSWGGAMPLRMSIWFYLTYFCQMICHLLTLLININRPQQNGHFFTDDILKYIFLNEKCGFKFHWFSLLRVLLAIRHHWLR